MNITIDIMKPEDWKTVSEIYAEGIATGNATFETSVPTWETWNSGHLESCRLLAKQQDSIVGWAAFSPVSRRKVYAGVVEHSIYIASPVRGQGVGKILLNALIDASEREGIWTIQTSIFPENTVSLALHRACGFREVGRRERIAQLHGIWRDTVLLERRSAVVGI
ncbi:MAG TPA: GNAT family N-acetyltransferase [Aggregatilineales bacterium]|nr:GNAT family N-acetyltransferase [Aggregatilineales bacterium]